jgi:hypothetical protein
MIRQTQNPLDTISNPFNHLGIPSVTIPHADNILIEPNGNYRTAYFIVWQMSRDGELSTNECQYQFFPVA